MAKKCKCKIISFGHINLYILLIPLGTLLIVAIEGLFYLSKKLGKEHPIIITINYSLGLFLSFIPFIIYKKHNKRNKTKNIFLFENKMNIFTQNKEITKKEKFLWILLCSVLDFIAYIIYTYDSVVKDDYIVFWPTNILLMSLFAYLILKMKLYKHHYLSIIIITIIGTAYNLISGNFDLDKLKTNYKLHIRNFFTESIFNILYILYKFFMLKKYINLYSILFFQGIIELVLGIITLIITTKYFKSFDSFYTYIDGIDGTEIGLFIGLVFVNFLSSIVLYIIIDIFSIFTNNFIFCG